MLTHCSKSWARNGANRGTQTETCKDSGYSLRYALPFSPVFQHYNMHYFYILSVLFWKRCNNFLFITKTLSQAWNIDSYLVMNYFVKWKCLREGRTLKRAHTWNGCALATKSFFFSGFITPSILSSLFFHSYLMDLNNVNFFDDEHSPYHWTRRNIIITNDYIKSCD